MCHARRNARMSGSKPPFLVLIARRFRVMPRGERNSGRSPPCPSNGARDSQPNNARANYNGLMGHSVHAQPTVSAGTLFFPMPRAGEVLHTWRRWIRTVSNRTMSCGRLLQLPPLPELPAPLRGQAFVAVEVAHQGDVAELNKVVSPLRDLGPVMDTITEIPTARLAELHMDPPGPTPCRGNGMLLNHVPPPAIDALVACAGHGSGSPLLSVELRHLGGAIAQRPTHAGAVGHFDAEFAMYAVGVTPDTSTAAKVDAHVQVVERALGPWSASIHYANFDEHSAGGRERFHDRANLERLRAVKSRVDPTGLFTCGHPVTSPSMPANWVAGQSQPGGSH